MLFLEDDGHLTRSRTSVAECHPVVLFYPLRMAAANATDTFETALDMHNFNKVDADEMDGGFVNHLFDAYSNVDAFPARHKRR